MKQVTQETTDAWLSGDYTEERRPMVRATIAKWYMNRTPYRLNWVTSTRWKHSGKFNSALFNQTGPVRELRNIKSIKWSRSVDTDVATCEITLYNVEYLKDTDNPLPEEFDFPGWYTPNRGSAGENDPWNYASNDWKDWLAPDRMIRTYEGYGVDPDLEPDEDPNLYPSGVWLIDDVTMTTQGIITLTCRDLGAMLLTQPLFPPTVPHQIYPLWFEEFKQLPLGPRLLPSPPWYKPYYQKSSNDYVQAAELMDGTHIAVNQWGGVYGHKGRHARDSDTSTYWLSAGSPEPKQLEWIQFNMTATKVSGVKINIKGGPYTVYVSVHNRDLGWRGAARIPYTINATDGVNLHAGIRYVASYQIDNGETKVFKLPRVFKNINRIRLTFASSWNSGIGQVRLYRTALQEFSYSKTLAMIDDGATIPIGNYGDYTDIVKWLVCWGGFFWPPEATSIFSNRRTVDAHYDTPDSVLPKGRAWGDFENTGTTGFAKLDVDVWDKKPVMDGINAIRDAVGFEFWIDETGGVIWRLPNVWERGNYLTQNLYGDSRVRTEEIIEIDERTTLIDLSAKISSKNVRERIFVADVNGRYGTVVSGFNPNPTGQMRTAGWTDQYFRDEDETKRMADLIAIRQSFLYRQNQITIAANPAIQIDDQVVIYERLSGERYLHRIMSINSEFDFESGKWTYQLTTQWLGDAAFTEVAWAPTTLSDVTKQYLADMGHGSV